MCGFAGIISDQTLIDAQLDRLEQAGDTIAHRGPDETRRFLSTNRQCGLTFRRLSIIDVEGSHQPMSDESGKVCIVFNGEIYNFKELREKLTANGINFKTHGDTEVLLQLYLQKGPAMLDDIKGMFAFAIYDGRKNSLFLARDHLGQKPLWFSHAQNSFTFASELKGLKRLTNCHDSFSFQAIGYYLTMGYIPDDKSVYSSISRLQAGSYAIVDLNTFDIKSQKYWSPRPADRPESYKNAIEKTRELVKESVRSHLVSDVPVGVLLSGGIDSAIITAVASQIVGKENSIKTFTAGFDIPAFDERPIAQTIASHCKTDHTPLLVKPDLENIFSQIVNLYDQPFADSSALATWLICKQAREYVKVVLGGDGGDEVFAGYDRYRAMLLSERMGNAKFMGIKILAGLLKPFASNEERSRLRRIIRFTDGLGYPFSEQYFSYRCLFNIDQLQKLISEDFLSQIDVDEIETWFTDLYEQGDYDSEVTHAQHHDLLSYLPDDLLVKTDIASMACGLELRAPLLDPNLVEFGLGLPVDWKINKSKGKHILREAFKDMLPKKIFNLPKKGFGLPLGDWFRNELRDQTKTVLTSPELKTLNIFNQNALASLFNEHITNQSDHRHRLWATTILATFLTQ